MCGCRGGTGRAGSAPGSMESSSCIPEHFLCLSSPPLARGSGSQHVLSPHSLILPEQGCLALRFIPKPTQGSPCSGAQLGFGEGSLVPSPQAAQPQPWRGSGDEQKLSHRAGIPPACSTGRAVHLQQCSLACSLHCPAPRAGAGIGAACRNPAPLHGCCPTEGRAKGELLPQDSTKSCTRIFPLARVNGLMRCRVNTARIRLKMLSALKSSRSPNHPQPRWAG